MEENIIKKLDDSIVKLISAGEVIESPCSVIKELVENSIDSGANSIVVEIKNGGKDYIRVTDNGIGIDEKYVEMAFKKHTTSKITTFDDFINIRTNGFRGEALASISAVAKISMVTKTQNSNYGVNIVINNDRLIEKSKVGAKDGTTVIVENLFDNIPARKKFLKSDRAESTKISDFLIRYALANPNIKIRYINNSKQIFQTYATGNLKDVVNLIFADNYDNSIIEIDENLSPYLSIQGIIGNNSAMFSSRKMQYIFINGRIIKDRIITAHIENAYKKFIPSGNFPMFFINILINPNQVDVNIHPNKLEVKFSDEKSVYSLIENKIANILDSYTMIPQIKLVEEIQEENDKIFSKIISKYENIKKENSNKDEEIFQEEIKISKKYEDSGFKYIGNNSNNKKKLSKSETEDDFDKNKVDLDFKEIEKDIAFNDKNLYDIKNKQEENYEKITNDELNYDDKNYNKIDINEYNFTNNNESNMDSLEIVSEEKALYAIPKDVLKGDINLDISDNKVKFIDLTLLKYGGRIFDTYIILFDSEDMYMIDQHAAHERVLYERYLTDFYNNDITIQQLLIPQNIGIPINLVDNAQDIIENLNNFGFETDLFGDNIILIRGVPSYFNEESSKKFIDTVFDIYLSENTSNDIIKDKIATKACKAAIKGNDHTVKEIEVEKLIYDLEHCENKYACPHGRPTITRLSKYEIEKFFKRIL